MPKLFQYVHCECYGGPYDGLRTVIVMPEENIFFRNGDRTYIYKNTEQCNPEGFTKFELDRTQTL